MSTVVDGDPPIRRGGPFESLLYIDTDAGLLLNFFFWLIRHYSQQYGEFPLSLWISVSFSLIFPLRTSGVQLELRTTRI